MEKACDLKSSHELRRHPPQQFPLTRSHKKLLAFLLLLGGLWSAYTQICINVPTKHYAVLVHKTGLDMHNHQEIAQDCQHKGLQPEVLLEGRYFKNPFDWDWNVYPMIEIPSDKLGVRIRLQGNDLPAGQLIASSEADKGIVQEVLKPGRYSYNALLVDGKTQAPLLTQREQQDYAEVIELWEPMIILAGYQGVVTNLTGPLSEHPNVLLVEAGKRGPQSETLGPGTYYLNPYRVQVHKVDCRVQSFHLSAQESEIVFPCKDGLWLSLDGVIEFHVKPQHVAEVYVAYNDVSNDSSEVSRIGNEIIRKVIMPSAHSFCKLHGTSISNRDLIDDEALATFQVDFQAALRDTCNPQGVEIVQALITHLQPLETVAKPVGMYKITL